ncbi:Rieske iron-sulfur protein [Brevipalpus obovatus]|uniref:Rieske iron-sulfur protein n=1 Tax=Brevipalpus obovatus TaxID=246614 RepID=UPI003D9DE2FE
MLAIASRPTNIGNLVKATSQAVNVKKIGPSVFASHDHVYTPEDHRRWSISSFNGQELLKKARATSLAVNGLSQVRLAHTDIQVPDFDSYRKESTKDPKKPARENYDGRRAANWAVTAGLTAGSLIVGKAALRGTAGTFLPSKEALAFAKIEVNLAEIPEGKSLVAKWLGKPVFIKHRTKEEIEAARAVDISILRDPQKDEDRCRDDPKWLVVIGVCTHLGCVPMANAGDYGGYYCPCHGSHYDTSGRVRKGPAPMNLDVPEYEIKGDLLIVG